MGEAQKLNRTTIVFNCYGKWPTGWISGCIFPGQDAAIGGTREEEWPNDRTRER